MLIWTTLGHFWTILGTFGRLFSGYGRRGQTRCTSKGPREKLSTQKLFVDYILVRAPRAAADENRSHRAPPNAYQVIMRWSDALIDQRADGQHH